MRPPGPRSPIASPLPATIVGPDGRALPWEGVSAPSAGGGAQILPLTLGLEWLLLFREEDVTLNGSDAAAVANVGTAGDALDVAHGTPANQPAYDSADATMNGQPAITCAGSEWLETADSPTDLDVPDGGSLFLLVVSRRTSASGSDYLIGTSGTTSGRIAVETATSGGGNSRLTVTDAGGTTTVNGLLRTVDAIQIDMWEIRGAASPSNDEFQHFISGSAGGSGAADKGAITPGANGMEWQVGTCFNNGFSGGWFGQIGEVWARTSILTAQEESDAVAYFNAKYGLALSSLRGA